LPKDTAKQLQLLPRLPRNQLKELWTEFYRQALPPKFPKDLLVRCLAYRLQEQIYGALGHATRRRLRQLADEIDNGATPTFLDRPRIKPGTRLIREWRGETHAVTVIEKGFTYRGAHYKSLSEIARRITHTRWSGPLFFGLKQSRVDKPEHVDAG
jgi:hypothetical protein